jgi:hypothetical protein
MFSCLKQKKSKRCSRRNHREIYSETLMEGPPRKQVKGWGETSRLEIGVHFDAKKNWGKIGTPRTYMTSYCISGWIFSSFSEPSFHLQMCVGYSYPGSGTTQITPTWPRDHQCPSPLIHYWLLEITRFFPSHKLASVLKALGKENEPLSASNIHLVPPHPFVLPSLNL